MKINEYAYEDLRNAVKVENTTKNRLSLLKWCELYDDTWNGEYYKLDNGTRIFPIYKNGKLVDAEIK